MSKSTIKLTSIKTDQRDSDYLQWKGWSAQSFAQLNHRARRYYRWHMQRAWPNTTAPRVLEIGFGNGAFLGYCREQHWPVTGIEVEAGLGERNFRAYLA